MTIDTCTNEQTLFIEKVLRREVGSSVIDKMSATKYKELFEELANIFFCESDFDRIFFDGENFYSVYF